MAFLQQTWSWALLLVLLPVLIHWLQIQDYRRFGYNRRTTENRATAAQKRGAVLVDLGVAQYNRKKNLTASKLFTAALAGC